MAELVEEVQQQQQEEQPKDSDNTEREKTAGAGAPIIRDTKGDGPLIGSDRLEEAADFIEQHTILWDTTDTNWKRQDLKADAWAEGALQFGLTVNLFKVWYNSLRTDLSRILKDRRNEKSGSAAVQLGKKKKWLYERFAFLRDFIKGRDQGKELMSVSSLFFFYGQVG